MKLFDLKPLQMQLLLCLCSVLIALLIDKAEIVQAASPADAINCDIQHGPCILKSGDGMSFFFDIQPKPVTSMIENTFIVTLSRNKTAVTDATIRVDLSMPGMFMGTNQLVLKHGSNGRYEGKGVITRCASGKKTWQADVAVASAATTTIARFIFEVK